MNDAAPPLHVQPGTPPLLSNVLLVRLSAIGDVVDCLPALTALHRALPGARLSWLVEERCAPVLTHHPHLTEIIAVPRRKWVRGLRSLSTLPGTLAEMLRFYSALRKRSFDAVFDFHGNLKSGINGFLTGAPLRIGLAPEESKEGNSLFLTRKASPCRARCHRVERNLSLLRAAGIEPGPPRFLLPVDPGALETVRPAASEGARPLVLLHPHASAKGAYKRWPMDRWRELVSRMVLDLQLKPVVLWGPGEREDAELLVREGAVLAPQTDLLELTALLSLADLLVGSDSGPVHMAMALNVPVVALFGPKDPAVYGPLREGAGRAVSLHLPCSPCRDTNCADVRCLSQIGTDLVLKAVEEILAASESVQAGRIP